MSKTANLMQCPVCPDRLRAKGYPVHMAGHVRKGEAIRLGPGNYMAAASPAPTNGAQPTNGVAHHVNGASVDTHVLQAIESIDAQMLKLATKREALKQALEA